MDRLTGSMMMIDKTTEPCRHLRTGGTRAENGYEKKCLACGYEWFVEDEPMTEADKADRARFEQAKNLGLI